MPPRMPTSRCGCGLALKPRLAAERMTNVYETLERPLVPVLARMEARGIKVDRADPVAPVRRVRAEARRRSRPRSTSSPASSFNIGSPKQLGDILFGKMGLPGGTKTKTGAWSTGADVLEELAEQGNELAARILDWRQLSKLKSTYTDSLPDYIHPETGRVHTSYALGLDHHRAALLVRAEPAEHPDPHRGRPRASAPPSSPSRA